MVIVFPHGKGASGSRVLPSSQASGESPQLSRVGGAGPVRWPTQLQESAALVNDVPC